MVKGDEYHPIRIPVSEEGDETGYGVSIFDLGDKDETNWPIEGRDYEQPKPEETESTGGETMTEETYDSGVDVMFDVLGEEDKFDQYAERVGLERDEAGKDEVLALGAAAAVYEIEQTPGYSADDVNRFGEIAGYLQEAGVDTGELSTYKGKLGGDRFGEIVGKGIAAAQEANAQRELLEVHNDLLEGLYAEAAADREEADGVINGLLDALGSLNTDPSSLEDSRDALGVAEETERRAGERATRLNDKADRL